MFSNFVGRKSRYICVKNKDSRKIYHCKLVNTNQGGC